MRDLCACRLEVDQFHEYPDFFPKEMLLDLATLYKSGADSKELSFEDYKVPQT